mgnify:CR=1 FL=1
MVIISSILLTIAAVGQIILAIVFHNPDDNALVINIGWGVLMLSGVFGWLPIFTFRQKGQVEGKRYINTTVLVDSGVYGIVATLFCYRNCFIAWLKSALPSSWT